MKNPGETIKNNLAKLELRLSDLFKKFEIENSVKIMETAYTHEKHEGGTFSYTKTDANVRISIKLKR